MKYALGGAAGIAALIAVFAWAAGRYAPALAAGAEAWATRAVTVTSALLGYGLACVATAALLLFAVAALIDVLRGRR